MSEDQEMTICEQCGELFDVNDAQTCEACGLDPLCPICIGRLDHTGHDGQLCGESDDEG